jgi:hypothetical protein
MEIPREMIAMLEVKADLEKERRRLLSEAYHPGPVPASILRPQSGPQDWPKEFLNRIRAALAPPL